jgi:ADP-ribosylglycohydrolase
MQETDTELHDRIVGVLLGGAVGDALGLPMEGLSRRRATRMFPGLLRHRLLFGGRGLCSDDTEHACMTASALLRHPDDADAFARALAWRLRWWLLGMPAGVGLATLRAILRLWAGVSCHRSGVRSAGNGPAMRAAVIGAFFREDEPRLRTYIRASTRLTHTDVRAERGALLVALAAARAVRCGRADGVLDLAIRETVDDPELHACLLTAAEHLRLGKSPQAFAEAIGLSRGVGGYINHTVPAALYCWLHAPRDFAQAVGACVALGGDTDSTAAISGALCGATAGASAIPQRWLDGLVEYPRSVRWMRGLGADVVLKRAGRPAAVTFLAALMARNTAFAAIVLAHGLRRLLPPY